MGKIAICGAALGALLAVTPAAGQQPADFEWEGAIAAGRTLEIHGVNGRIEAGPASGGTATVRGIKEAKHGAELDRVTIDVFEHVEDYMGFLRKLRTKAQYKIFHIPLDLSVQGILRRSFLPARRESVGHLHYFTEDTALATLRDTGYRILEASFTTVDAQIQHPTRKGRIAKWPRTLLGKVNPSVASRVLGGFSLLVLAE